jgi:hypothetical protein
VKELAEIGGLIHGGPLSERVDSPRGADGAGGSYDEASLDQE